ncbi:MAG: hypothetical protein ACYDEX_10760 [Mobilitalea sp.]
MDFKILLFLDKLKPIFQKLEIEYTVMRKILQVKLTMDGRRVPTIFTNSKQRSNTDNGNQFLKSLWLYALLGIILIPFIIMKTNYIFQMGIVFSIVMFFVMTSLISDFSSVLLDIKDKNIIGTRPVGPKTLRMAKTIHILIYMFYITIALVGPALIVSLFVQGIIFFFIFILSIILLDIFCIILTTLIYFLVLRFFDGEKLKDIINYIQIILSMVVMIGYQLVGRLFNIVDLRVEFVPSWWQYFIAPIWFSAPFQMIKKSEVNRVNIIFSVMAIVIPVMAMVIYIKLMPVFEKNLQKLSNNNEKLKKAKGKFDWILSRTLCRSNEERIFFRFALHMMRNEREFKLKVYPTLGFSLVIPFLFLLPLLTESSFQEISQGKTYLMLYCCGLMLPTALIMLRYSENYKGAWIYKALPIKNFAPIFKGTTKAFIIRLFTPIFLLEAIIFIAIYGTRIIPDLLIIFINIMIFNILCFTVMDKALPFSKGFEVTQQSNTGLILILISLLAGMAGIHYLVFKITCGIYIYLILVFIINLILWKVAFNISPDKLKK